MNFNFSTLGSLVIVSVIVTGLLAYMLSRRKETRPAIVTLFGLVLGLSPPFNILYLAYLFHKKPG